MIKLLFLSLLSAITIIGTISISSFVFAANSSSPLEISNNPIPVQLLSKELQNLGPVLTGQLQNLQNNSQTMPSNNTSFQANIFNSRSNDSSTTSPFQANIFNSLSNDSSNPSSLISPHFLHSSNDQ